MPLEENKSSAQKFIALIHLNRVYLLPPDSDVEALVAAGLANLSMPPTFEFLRFLCKRAGDVKIAFIAAANNAEHKYLTPSGEYTNKLNAYIQNYAQMLGREPALLDARERAVAAVQALKEQFAAGKFSADGDASTAAPVSAPSTSSLAAAPQTPTTAAAAVAVAPAAELPHPSLAKLPTLTSVASAVVAAATAPSAAASPAPAAASPASAAPAAPAATAVPPLARADASSSASSSSSSSGSTNIAVAAALAAVFGGPAPVVPAAPVNREAEEYFVSTFVFTCAVEFVRFLSHDFESISSSD